ncbi:hypothetical protein ACWD4G_41270 [Streptomyces sp. NPDC002643]
MTVSVAGKLLRERLAEAIDIIEAGEQPFLLAVPTDSTGALDASVLVRRISLLDGLGVTPAPVELAQALLRVTPTEDEKVRDAAGQLVSDGGRRLALWLREGGLPHGDSRLADWHDGHPDRSVRDLVNDALPEPPPGPPLLPAAAALIECQRNAGLEYPMLSFWLAQMPHHRDVVLARD